MLKRLFERRAGLLTVALALISACATAEVIKGDYVYGHEVNIFCPAESEQCYWLSPKTSDQIRLQLKNSIADSQINQYQPLCVRVKAELDSVSPMPAMAEDYSGLIYITELVDRC